nr:hypothetical protein [Legionella norrlandica]
MQLVGEQLTISAALTGRDVRTMPDFPAEIRLQQELLPGFLGFSWQWLKEPFLLQENPWMFWWL